MKNSINLAGAYIGIIIGAGFASGQEVLQFFTSFGIYSVLGIVVATALFAFLGMQVTQLGSTLQTRSHKSIIDHICGRYYRQGGRYYYHIFLVWRYSHHDCRFRNDF